MNRSPEGRFKAPNGGALSSVWHRAEKAIRGHPYRARLTGPVFLTLAMAAALSWSSVTRAQFQATPYVATRIEYDSNVFDLPKRGEDGNTAVGALVLKGIVGAELEWLIGQQRLHSTLEQRHIKYQEMTELDHSEYLYELAFDWRRGSLLDGAMDYRRERRMASFLDRVITELTLETERTAGAALNLAVSPRWRLETAFESRQLRSPLPEFPRFQLEEETSRLGLRYHVDDLVNAGLLLESIGGGYTGQMAAPSFEQLSWSLMAARTVPGLMQIDAALGYTRRKEGAGTGSSQSAVIGSLGYQREISGKTALTLIAFRRLRSNTADSEGVVEVGLDGALRWQLTDKSSIDASYQVTGSDYGSNGVLPSDEARRDVLQQFKLTVTWRARRWLLLRPYVGYQWRTANQALFRFSGYAVGLDIVLRFEL
ncbi:hypothetical protein [Pseudomarimonas salicorniae]|uniref:DUF3570 domain-containing protein n=1 Tax=Pseudomarimonas salicorniae TaxID=2933270 RepID=A0ABT0GEW4_9GAMM|nr:hypothetical protein [Lysobacter sp. CAU 1642]MCK7593090.1 hypothetical protein [Lysobacter sp. CAU 1642]